MRRPGRPVHGTCTDRTRRGGHRPPVKPVSLRGWLCHPWQSVPLRHEVPRDALHRKRCGLPRRIFDAPRNDRGLRIATPVCALARNDTFFWWCVWKSAGWRAADRRPYGMGGRRGGHWPPAKKGCHCEEAQRADAAIRFPQRMLLRAERIEESSQYQRCAHPAGGDVTFLSPNKKVTKEVPLRIPQARRFQFSKCLRFFGGPSGRPVPTICTVRGRRGGHWPPEKSMSLRGGPTGRRGNPFSPKDVIASAANRGILAGSAVCTPCGGDALLSCRRTRK